jgi:cyclopropane fatty-acyl-phospholipid synthase-like methyltransferase
LRLNYSKVIVELGIGNGELLEKIAGHDKNVDTIYIGIEINANLYDGAKSRISFTNVMLIKGSYEAAIASFPDNSIDKVISILPSPEFIDQSKQDIWKSFYKCLFAKLKKNGIFQLVTELTNDLFEPVSDDIYDDWVKWLICTFNGMGFKVLSKKDGPPRGYSTRFLDQFKGDSKRIRILTLNLKKMNLR